jgi:hypothetical protein
LIDWERSRTLDKAHIDSLLMQGEISLHQSEIRAGTKIVQNKRLGLSLRLLRSLPSHNTGSSSAALPLNNQNAPGSGMLL